MQAIANFEDTETVQQYCAAQYECDCHGPVHLTSGIFYHAHNLVISRTSGSYIEQTISPLCSAPVLPDVNMLLEAYAPSQVLLSPPLWGALV